MKRSKGYTTQEPTVLKFHDRFSNPSDWDPSRLPRPAASLTCSCDVSGLGWQGSCSGLRL